MNKLRVATLQMVIRPRSMQQVHQGDIEYVPHVCGTKIAGSDMHKSAVTLY